MSKKSLLFGLLPLVVFAVIDSIADVEAGVISAIIFALMEAAWTCWHFKRIDSITAGSLLLVLLFGTMTWITEDAFFFKIQSVIFGVIFGLLMIVLQAMGRPLMVIMVQKYSKLFPAPIRSNLDHPALKERLSLLSAILGPGLLIHSALTVYAIFFLSTWWWLAIRGAGLYIMMSLCVLLVRFKSQPG